MPIADYAPLITAGSTLLGVVVGGSITYFVQSHINRQNIAAQRYNSYSDKQVSAFLDVMQLVSQPPEFQGSEVGTLEETVSNSIVQLARWNNSLGTAQAQMLAYGTDEMVSRFASFTQAFAVHLQSMTDEVARVMARGDNREELKEIIRPHMAVILEHSGELVTLMRNEIQAIPRHFLTKKQLKSIEAA